MGRAIVTFARGWQALAATRSLGRRSIEVHCGEEAPFAPCFFSRYCKGHFRYPSVSDDPEAFVDFMVEKVKELKPPDGEPYVLLPVHKETWLIARHRERFEPHIGLALADYEWTTPPFCSASPAAKPSGKSPNPGTLWGAFAHTLTHGVNLFILYFLAALLLREGRTKRGEVPPAELTDGRTETDGRTDPD